MNRIIKALSITLCIVCEASAQCELQKALASDGQQNASYGHAVDIDGQVAVIGAVFDNDTGAAYIYELQGTKWVEQAKLQPSDLVSGDNFGVSVAVDGDTVLVGSSVNGGSGAVYVYENQPGRGWTQAQKVLSSTQITGQGFGASLAISGDRFIAGAPGDTTAGVATGAVYVFERGASGGAWIESIQLLASDPAPIDFYGYEVDLHEDTIAIAAPFKFGTGAASGAVYTYEFDGSSWSESDYISGNPGESFGTGLAISNDTLAAGAPMVGVGTVRMYTRQGDDSWALVNAVTTSDAIEFGYKISLDDDAEGTMIVGARGSNDAYLIHESNGVWAERAKLKPNDTAGDDSFGISVGLSGHDLIIGASRDDDLGSGSGAAYVFFAEQPGDSLKIQDNCDVSVSSGGAQSVSIDVDSALSGQLYWIAGSISGTSPGTPFGQTVVPLNVDPYFNFTLQRPNTAPLFQSVGYLDASGAAQMDFSLSAGSSATLAGNIAYHAGVVTDLATGELYVVTNAVPVRIVP